MPNTTIYIGDLVSIKKKLQRFIAIPKWGIVIDETVIIPADVPDNESIEPIDSFIVYFPASDETFTIPENCLKKITLVEE